MCVIQSFTGSRDTQGNLHSRNSAVESSFGGRIQIRAGLDSEERSCGTKLKVLGEVSGKTAKFSAGFQSSKSAVFRSSCLLIAVVHCLTTSGDDKKQVQRLVRARFRQAENRSSMEEWGVHEARLVSSTKGFAINSKLAPRGG